ncbi:MAG TPA: glucans biosynthesis glucosyltransferase MdoH, partial [Beijerinckiaceae bacterium]|nr:glucans biosynthesis glucosyltransferase MdoH [Beijerinckiaceae bacterium]
MNEPAQLAASGVIEVLGTTPTGLQSERTLSRRRLVMLGLSGATYLALAAVMAEIADAGGWTVVDVILFLCFLVATPWTVLGFWNALVGIYLLHGRKDGLSQAAPFAAAAASHDPVRLKTAVLMTVRNEEPARAIRRLRIVQEGLDATGEGKRFAYFVLSDTSEPDVAAAEEAAVAAWKAEIEDPDRIVYRRREHN